MPHYSAVAATLKYCTLQNHGFSKATKSHTDFLEDAAVQNRYLCGERKRKRRRKKKEKKRNKESPILQDMCSTIFHSNVHTFFTTMHFTYLNR